MDSIRWTQRMIERTVSLRDGMAARLSDGAAHSPTVRDAMADSAGRLDDLCRLLTERVTRLAVVTEDICNALDAFARTGGDAEPLRLRYVEGMTVRELSDALLMSERGAAYRLQRAEESFSGFS